MNTKWIRFLMIVLVVIGAAVLIWKVPAVRNGNHAGTHAAHKKDIYYCPMHPTYTSDRPGDCPICNMKLVKKEDGEGTGSTGAPPRTFTVEELLGMKPGEICLLHKCKTGTCLIAMTEEFARLGICPYCGEDLGVIVKEAVPAGYGQVKLAPEKQRLIGIKTAAVTKSKVTKTIRTVGRIAYDPELYQAEQEYVQAIQSQKRAEAGTIQEVKDQAARLVDSSKIRLKLLGLSEDLIQEIAAAGKPDRSLLYSEAGGTVWLYAPIYEYELGLVKAEQEIEAEVPSIAGKKFSGTIRSIDPVLDAATRSARVRAVLENTEGLLKPEMYVNAAIRIDLGEVLVVPREAVFSTGEKNIVFAAKPDGLFEPREVSLGVQSEAGQEVKSGVSEGESVVVSGNFLIDSESRLKGALEGLGGGGHQHGG